MKFNVQSQCGHFDLSHPRLDRVIKHFFCYFFAYYLLFVMFARLGIILHQTGIGHNHSHGIGGGHSHSQHSHDNDDSVSTRRISRSSSLHSVEKQNINVRAAFIHVLGDIVQSVGVLIAAYVIKFKVI